MAKDKEEGEYFPVKIPVVLVKNIDDVLTEHGYSSRQEFVRDAVRRLLDAYKSQKP